MNINDFKEKFKEVTEIKKQSETLTKDLVYTYTEKYSWVSEIYETYARIMYFLTHGYSVEKLERVGQRLYNNDVERLVLQYPYMANYVLHRLHTLRKETRKQAIRCIADWDENYLKIEFPNIVGNCWDDLPLPKEVEEFLNRFDDDIYWETGMSWVHDHTDMYENCENLELKIETSDLHTLKYILDNIQSVTEETVYINMFSDDLERIEQRVKEEQI